MGVYWKRIIRIQNLTDAEKPFNLTNRTVADQYLVRPGDLLVSWSASLGVFEWQGPDVAVLNQHIFRVVPKADLIDKTFLRYALNEAVEEMERFTHGSTMKHINRAEFLSTRIFAPPLPEQQRIAAILDKADAIRRKRQAALQLTEELLRSAFLEMFGDPVTNPKGWPQKRLGDMGQVTTGNTPSRACPNYYGNEIEWIKSDNINTPHHFLTKASEGLSKEGMKVGRVVPAGSILVTCIAGSPDCIGNAAIADRAVSFNQQINAISPTPDVETYFLYSQILLGKKLIQQSSTDSMKGMVSKSRFEEVLLIAPPKELQSEFTSRFSAIGSTLQRQTEAIEQTDVLFHSLVQRAFRGEL